jgi:hypothetical protein
LVEEEDGLGRRRVWCGKGEKTEGNREERGGDETRHGMALMVHARGMFGWTWLVSSLGS